MKKFFKKLLGLSLSAVMILSLGTFAAVNAETKIPSYILAEDKIVEYMAAARNTYPADTEYTTSVVDNYDADLDTPKPVTLSWSAIEGAESYTLTISESSDFSNPIVIESITTTEYDIYNLKVNTDYWWKVSDGTTDTAASQFKTGDSVRFIKADNAMNIRDIGGWNGLNQGMAYRGSELNSVNDSGCDLTDEGKKVLRDDLGIKTDLDLRYDYKDGDVNKGTGAIKESPLGSDINWLNYAVTGYGELFTESGQSGYKKSLSVFADSNNYPIYFHCAGGADRTGTLAFVLEALSGVSLTDVDIDYELTSFSTYGSRKRTSNGTLNYKGTATTFLEYEGDTLQDKAEYYALNVLGMTKAQVSNIQSLLAGNKVTFDSTDDINAGARAKISLRNLSGNEITDVKNNGSTVTYKVKADGVEVAADEGAVEIYFADGTVLTTGVNAVTEDTASVTIDTAAKTVDAEITYAEAKESDIIVALYKGNTLTGIKFVSSQGKGSHIISDIPYGDIPDKVKIMRWNSISDLSTIDAAIETEIPVSKFVLAEDNFADYNQTSGSFKNYPTEGASNVNGGYGWADAWNNGSSAFGTNPSFATLGNAEDKVVYGYNPTVMYRTMSNPISLNESGTYYAEFMYYISNQIYGGFFSGISFYDTSGKEVLRAALKGNTEQTALAPYIKIGSTENKIESYDFNKQTYYKLSAKITVNPNGEDTIDLTCSYDSSSKGAFTNSVTETLTAELGTTDLSKLKYTFGSPTRVYYFRISQQIFGAEQDIAHVTVAEDNLTAAGYKNTAAHPSNSDITDWLDPTANLGSGWADTWAYNVTTSAWLLNNTWNLDFAYAGTTNNHYIKRTLSEGIDFSKDGEYKFKFRGADYNYDVFGGLYLYNESGSEIIAVGKQGVGSESEITKHAAIKIGGNTIKSEKNSNSWKQVLLTFDVTIKVNSDGADIVTVEGYNASNKEETYLSVTTETELNGKVAKKVGLWSKRGGFKDISIAKSTAKAIVTSPTEIYISFNTPSANNTVTVSDSTDAEIKLIKNANGEAVSAIINVSDETLSDISEYGITVNGVAVSF